MRIPRELTLSADLGGSSNYLNKRKIKKNKFIKFKDRSGEGFHNNSNCM